MIVKGCILKIVEHIHNGKLRVVVVLRTNDPADPYLNNQLAVYFTKFNKYLLEDFSVDDMVLIDCKSHLYTNEEKNLYISYITGKSIRFDTSQYPYYRKKAMGRKYERMQNRIIVPEDFDYEKMIMNGWTNEGLIEAGYVKRK